MRTFLGIAAMSSLMVLSGCDGEPDARIPLGSLKEPYNYTGYGEAAVYSIRHVSPGENSTVISINTRHSSQSGWSYTKRAYNCEKGLTMTLATADTYDGMANSKPDARWSNLVRGSSAYFTGEYACKVVGRLLNA